MFSPPLTLFVDAFFSSPFDFRCWVALKEKGLEFSASRAMMHEGQGLTAEYKERSVTARVPGLLHGDFWLAESLAIVEYIEEAFPPPAWPSLFPGETRARARARQVMSFLSSDLPALVRERPAWSIFYPSPRPPLSAPARADADELFALVRRLLAEGALESWSIACADLAFALLRLTRSGEVLPPELQAFLDPNAARPSVASYVGHERPPHPPLTGRRVSA